MKHNSKNNSYLSFRLDKEQFSLEVKHVINILEMVKITKVPKAPDFMVGVINLRGSVLPVIDLRLKFNLPKIQITKNTCILVLDVKINGKVLQIGSLVDSVEEVFEYNDDKILPPPALGEQYRSEFISGLIEKDELFIMIIDINKVFSINDINVLKQDSTITA